jgi:hypothetical protein
MAAGRAQVAAAAVMDVQLVVSKGVAREWGPRRAVPPGGAGPLAPGYSDAAWKVSHWRRSPLCRPRVNQRTRCSEVPCVNESGTT